MKKYLVLFVLVVWGAAGAWAQGTKAVRALGRARKVTSLAVGNYNVVLPPAVRQMCRGDVLQQYFSDGKISPVVYPKLSVKNDALTFQAVQQLAEDALQFKNNYARIASDIAGFVYEGEVPYRQFLPEDPGIIYLGEIHEQPRIQREIISLLHQLPQIYPGRTIYLASEFLPTSALFSVEENIVSSHKLLEERLDIENQTAGGRVLHAALEENIRLVGLEDHLALMYASTPRGKRYPTPQQYEDYATSYEGMSYRNRLFAHKIREIQKTDPDALIVVYGGLAHMSYHEPSSVPHLLGGNSFVIQLTVPAALASSNPLFSYMKEDVALRQLFHASPSAKLVEWWKSNPSPYRHLLGNDLTVIVHE